MRPTVEAEMVWPAWRSQLVLAPERVLLAQLEDRIDQLGRPSGSAQPMRPRGAILQRAGIAGTPAVAPTVQRGATDAEDLACQAGIGGVVVAW